MNSTEELWRQIQGFEGYEVSSLGRVRSCDRLVCCKCGSIRLYKGRILMPQKNHDGYLTVGLSKDNKQTTFNVHKLVYEAFHGKIPEGMQVNHIDEDKTNNSLENLNMMTHKENMNWGTAIERRVKKLLNRKDCSKAIIQFDLEGNLISEFEGLHDAQRKLGICNQNICSVLNGRRKTAGGFIFKYKQ